MRVPLVLAGPGIPKGRSDALVYLLDLFPTVCALTGVRAPEGLDGHSLVPVMAGKKARVRDSLFLAYRDVQRAVRDERWKLIRYPHINRTQLFDLKNDPHEVRDLSAEASHRETVDRLLGLMRRWQKRLGDGCPLTSEKPRPAGKRQSRDRQGASIVAPLSDGRGSDLASAPLKPPYQR
jgi:arylsulfatase A-like enzyme